MVDQRPFHFAALRWYFAEYESEISIKAQNPMSLGGSGGIEENFERIRRAIRRARKVDAVLFAMPSKHRKVLALVHTPRQWPLDKSGGIPEHLKGIVCALVKPDGEQRKTWAERRFREAHESFTKTAEKLNVRGIE